MGQKDSESNFFSESSIAVSFREKYFTPETSDWRCGASSFSKPLPEGHSKTPKAFFGLYLFLRKSRVEIPVCTTSKNPNHRLYHSASLWRRSSSCRTFSKCVSTAMPITPKLRKPEIWTPQDAQEIRAGLLGVASRAHYEPTDGPSRKATEDA